MVHSDTKHTPDGPGYQPRVIQEVLFQELGSEVLRWR